jgi:uncharacterized protein (UPF0264 family)
MKVLISIKDGIEARAVAGVRGVDIIDVKNPLEGTLGANNPRVIEEVKEILPPETQIAASIGDLDFKPGGASLAAYGAASLGVDYVTASMFKINRAEDVKIMTKKLLKALDEFKTGLIIAGYADFDRCGSISPFEFLPSISGADYIMVDTAIKDGKNILDFASIDELKGLKERAHDLGLKLILAGSIRYSQLELIKRVETDVIGFRGIVCENGRVKSELVSKLMQRIK